VGAMVIHQSMMNQTRTSGIPIPPGILLPGLTTSAGGVGGGLGVGTPGVNTAGPP
jgi:hypothetical protein